MSGYFHVVEHGVIVSRIRLEKTAPRQDLTKGQWVTGILCDGADVKGYERLVRLEWWGDRV